MIPVHVTMKMIKLLLLWSYIYEAFLSQPIYFLKKSETVKIECRKYDTFFSVNMFEIYNENDAISVELDLYRQVCAKWKNTVCRALDFELSKLSNEAKWREQLLKAHEKEEQQAFEVEPDMKLIQEKEPIPTPARMAMDALLKETVILTNKSYVTLGNNMHTTQEMMMELSRTEKLNQISQYILAKQTKQIHVLKSIHELLTFNNKHEILNLISENEMLVTLQNIEQYVKATPCLMPMEVQLENIPNKYNQSKFIQNKARNSLGIPFYTRGNFNYVASCIVTFFNERCHLSRSTNIQILSSTKK